MKETLIKFLFACCACITIFNYKIQAQDCVNVVNTIDFQKLYNFISNKSSDQLKLDAATTYLNNKCYNSQQIKQICALFLTDEYRYQYASAAYQFCNDKQNYFSVLDAFSSFSYAFKMYNEFSSQMVVTNTPPPPPPLPVVTFGNYTYPSSVGYSGLVACNLPLAENDFMNLVQAFAAYTTDAQIHDAAYQFMLTQCLSMAQQMMLASLMSLELNRLNFMKEAFVHCYDMENYSFASQLFSSQAYKVDWSSYCQNQIVLLTPPPPTPSCVITDNDLTQYKQAINHENFSDTKLKVLKQIMSSHPCFTVLQAKELVALLSFDGDKLDAAKYAWDYTTDHQNYYLMNDVFSFSSSQEDLIDYVNGKK